MTEKFDLHFKPKLTFFKFCSSANAPVSTWAGLPSSSPLLSLSSIMNSFKLTTDWLKAPAENIKKGLFMCNLNIWYLNSKNISWDAGYTFNVLKLKICNLKLRFAVQISIIKTEDVQYLQLSKKIGIKRSFPWVTIQIDFKWVYLIFAAKCIN